MAEDRAFVAGRTVLVTGSTDGIGRQTARELAELGARVLVHGRDPARVSRVVEDIQATGAEAEGFVANLASLAEVRRLAEQVLQAGPELHVLVNNAGVHLDDRCLTPEGLEETFTVNHLAPFLLTRLLLGRLVESAPARVINLTSVAHRSAYLDWQNLQGEQDYDGYDAYALSKLCNVLFTYELAERLRGTGVTANCLHPGVVDTKLLQAGFPGSSGISVREGARTPVYLASSPQLEGVTGEYFVDRRPQRSAGITYDKSTRRRLWEVSAALAGLAP